MSINNEEKIKVLNALDDITRITELQDLLQVVVDSPSPNDIESSKRVYLMCELFLHQTTPLLQNLTINLERLQKHYKEKL